VRVLLTGSRGYVGSVLVPMLLKAGHDVIGADTDYYSRCTFIGNLAEIPTRKADVRDAPWSELDGCQAVVHLAGLSNDPLGDYKPSLTEDINFRASVRLAQMAKRAGVERFLFASSCSNYGPAGDQFLAETAAFNPVTPYGVSKVLVEGELKKLADDRFSPVYLRAATAYGVSPRIRFDLALNNLTAWAFTTGRVYLKSDGSPWRPIVHVEDICRAYMAALHAPRELVHDQAFNVGSTSENYQIRELAEIVREVVPGCRVEYAPDAGPDKRCYRVDCNKIARTLHDFKPQWTARRGAEQLYLAYKAIGLRLEDFEGPRFMRIAHLRKLVADGLLDQELRWRVPVRATHA
jgi:nucleoside-diphosphate-sugar epimerase